MQGLPGKALAIVAPFYALKGAAAQQAFGPTATALLQGERDVRSTLATPGQQAAFDGSVGARVDQELARMQAHAAQQGFEEQQHQSQLLQQGSVLDALDHLDDPVAYRKFLETGMESILAQGALRGTNGLAAQQAAAGYLSSAHAQGIDRLLTLDPLAATAFYHQHESEMTPADQDEARQRLFEPMREWQAVGDVDRYALGRSGLPPETPPSRDPAELVAKMQAITPMLAPDDAASAQATDDSLPVLVQRYGGDAAKAWAAFQLGPDAVDAAIKDKGDGWFGALPDDTRAFVTGNMASLGAVSSTRQVPPPEDRAAVSQWIDDQPWNDARKQAAHQELGRRIGLDDRRRTQAADEAKDAAFALVDKLGAGFTSITQLPPEMRRALDMGATAAMTRIASRNIDPNPVPPAGDTADRLTQLAASDPDRFAREDLRLIQGDVTPGEYAAYLKLQDGWKGDPPSVDALNHQRVVEAILGGQHAQAVARDGETDMPQAVGAVMAGLPADDRGADMDGGVRDPESDSAYSRDLSESLDHSEGSVQKENIGGVVAAQADGGPDIVVTARRPIITPAKRRVTAPRKAIATPPVKSTPPSVSANVDFPEFWKQEQQKGRNLPPLIRSSTWRAYPPNVLGMRQASKDGSYNRITFHHTSSLDTPGEIERLHRGHETSVHHLGRWISGGGRAEEYKYGDVGYHFFIDHDGSIIEGRSLAYQGAHVGNLNKRNIGVAFLGDFSKSNITSAQVRAAKILVRMLNDAFGIYKNAGGQRYIYTHHDLAPKSRPDELVGANDQMKAIEDWSMAYGPKKK